MKATPFSKTVSMVFTRAELKAIARILFDWENMCDMYDKDEASRNTWKKELEVIAKFEEAIIEGKVNL